MPGHPLPGITPGTPRQHQPANAPGGIVIKPPPHYTTIQEWWGTLSALGNERSFATGAVRLPSGAIAPDQLLPVAYGAARVGGTALAFGGKAGLEVTDGWGVIAWCQGEIEGIDAFLCNGVPMTIYDAPMSMAWRHFAHYYGAVGDYRQDASGDIFCPYPRTNPAGYGGGPLDTSNFGAVAYTKLELYRSPPLGCQWWVLLPGGFEDSTKFEWAVDVRGLKIYDPRTGLTAYTTNPALIVRDILLRYGGLLEADVDEVSIAAAADACDAQGFTCNIAFATKTPISDAVAMVLQTCNGTLITSAGKVGLFLDAPNTSPPVLSLLEEDGDIWGLKYEWLSAQQRYTRLAVAFANKDADYKLDQTPDLDDPGIAIGAVPIKPFVVNAPGINTMAAAIILRDYLFNRQSITFRVIGTMNSRGIALQQGQKVRLTTLKGPVDADFLLSQISGDAQGFFSFVAQPYDSAVFGSTPVVTPPPVINPPPNPTVAGENITVTDDTATRQSLNSSTSNTTVYDVFQLIEYTLPAGGSPLKELHARGFRGTGAGSKTWDDMAGSEIVIPLTGNEPPPDASHFMLSVPGILKIVRTLTFATDGQLIQTVDAVGPTRIIIKTVTTADALSTGVTVDVAASTDTTTNPRTDLPLWKRVKSSTAADGSEKVFVIPSKPILSTLSVIADGQFLVESGDSPVEGADYSVSGLNVTIAAGRAAPMSYVLFVYQESVEP